MMKKKVKYILLLAAAAAVALAWALQALRPVQVGIEAAAPGPLGDSFTAQGTVVPAQSVILNANTTGAVQTLPLQVGAALQAGDPVASVDSALLARELENQVESLKLQKSALQSQTSLNQTSIVLQQEQLRTQLAAAKQEYERLFGDGQTAQSLEDIASGDYVLARRNWREARDLDEENGDLFSDSELFALRSQMNTAMEALIIAKTNNSASTKAYYEGLISSCEAQLSALSDSPSHTRNAALAAAQQLDLTIADLTEKLSRGALTAPFDGVVWEIYTEAGAFVAENQPVAKLYRPGDMRIETHLLSEDALPLSAGQTVSCKLADGTAFSAEISFVSPVANETLSTIGITENRCLVTLRPQNLPNNAGAGHQVDLTFRSVAAENVLSVPVSAVVPSGTANAVYLLRAGKAVLTEIETGVQSGGRVQILSGVSEGDRVILDPRDKGIRDNSRVTEG